MITATLNTRRVKKAMKGLERDLKNPRRLLNKVGTNSVKQIEDRIQSNKRDPDGRPWAAWSYNTLQQRTREGNAGQGLLYRTGQLLRSFRFDVGRQKVEIGTNVFYAKYLQTGDGTRMPSRQMLGWGRSNMKQFAKTAKEFFGRRWK